MLYTPAVIWSRAARPKTSDSITMGSPDRMPSSRYGASRSIGARSTAKHAACATTMAVSETTAREAITCAALTFASMSVRSVCFSFSSAMV